MGGSTATEGNIQEGEVTLSPVLGTGLNNNLPGGSPTLTQFLHQHLEAEIKLSRGLSLTKLSGFIMS